MSGILSALVAGSGGDSSFWILTIGYTGTTDFELYDIAPDTTGNLYVAGRDAANTKAFSSKITQTGSVSWQKTYDYSSGQSSFNGLAIDSAGDIYPVGLAWNTSTGTYQFSTNKITASTGAISFQRFLTSNTNPASLYDSAIDGSGNIYAIGYRNPSALSPRMFLAKYTSAGTISSQNLLSSSSSSGASVSADSSDNVYIAGTESGTVFAKLNSSLVSQWGYKLTRTSSTVGVGTISNDSSGNVYVCGDYTGTLSTAFILKYNSSGVFQWGRTVSGAVDVYGYAAAVDSAGNVYLTCTTSGADCLILKYNSSGSIQWQNSISNVSTLFSITISSGGSPVICGYSAESSLPGIVIKVPSNGSKTGTYSNGKTGGSYTYAASSYTDAAVTIGTTLTSASWSPTLTSQSLTDSAGSLTATTSSYTTAIATL
jgi:hypothetical protein